MGCFNSCGLWEVRVRDWDWAARSMPKAQGPIGVPVPLASGTTGTYFDLSALDSG